MKDLTLWCAVHFCPTIIAPCKRRMFSLNQLRVELLSAK